MANPQAAERRIAIIGSGFSGLCLGIQLEARRHRLLHDLREGRPRSAAPGATTPIRAPPATCRRSPTASRSSRRPTGRASGRRRPRSSPTWSTARASTTCCRTSASTPRSRARASTSGAACGGCARRAGEEIDAEVLVSGVGQLNRPPCPRSPGSSASAARASTRRAGTTRSISRGKRVGVIGNAASAIQFVPRDRAARRAGSRLPAQRQLDAAARRPRLQRRARSGASPASRGSRGCTAGGSGRRSSCAGPVFRAQPLPGAARTSSSRETQHARAGRATRRSAQALVARLPDRRQAHPDLRRLLPGAQPRERRARDDRHRAHRARTASSRATGASARVDALILATGFETTDVPGADARSRGSAGAALARRVAATARAPTSASPSRASRTSS